MSLFGGAVSASSVEATDGNGVATGLEINGAAVTATAGETVPVDGWGELTLNGTIGRVWAPLVLRLRRAHESLPAGTVVAVAFAASARPKPAASHALHRRATSASGKHSARTHGSGKHRHRHGSKRGKKSRRSFFWAHYRFPDGGLAPAARKNPAVSLALHYLGIRYVWAGARPKTGFDCSGLVQYVYAKLGVWLPHNAAAQWHSPDTSWVKPSKLKPGDLVFFRSDGTHRMPGHVGIYVGHGYLIDAPHTGAFVRVDSFKERWFARQFVGGKRVLGSLDGPVPQWAGAPKQHAPVTRHEVLGARDLFLHVPAPAASAGIVAVPAAAHTAAPERWTGIGLGSALLLLTGAFGYRRRRRAPEADPSPASSS